VRWVLATARPKRGIAWPVFNMARRLNVNRGACDAAGTYI